MFGWFKKTPKWKVTGIDYFNNPVEMLIQDKELQTKIDVLTRLSICDQFKVTSISLVK